MNLTKKPGWRHLTYEVNMYTFISNYLSNYQYCTNANSIGSTHILVRIEKCVLRVDEGRHL